MQRDGSHAAVDGGQHQLMPTAPVQYNVIRYVGSYNIKYMQAIIRYTITIDMTTPNGQRSERDDGGDLLMRRQRERQTHARARTHTEPSLMLGWCVSRPDRCMVVEREGRAMQSAGQREWAGCMGLAGAHGRALAWLDRHTGGPMQPCMYD